MKLAGRLVTREKHHEGEQCLLVGDSIIRNVGTDQNNVMVECFGVIRTEKLHRVLNNRSLGTADAVVIHADTNDLKRSVNLDCVMGEGYWLGDSAKDKVLQSKIMLSGVLRRTDVSWRHIGTLNDTNDWITKTLGAAFLEPNS
jgi:hydrogenase maturation factor